MTSGHADAYANTNTAMPIDSRWWWNQWLMPSKIDCTGQFQPTGQDEVIVPSYRQSIIIYTYVYEHLIGSKESFS